MKRRVWFGSVLFTVVSLFLLGGCLSTRGVVYLQNSRVRNYLASQESTTPAPEKPAEGKKEGKKEDKPADAPVEGNASLPLTKEAKENMAAMPDGNKVLGGYCNDAEVKKHLDEMETMSVTCMTNLKLHRNRANLNGGLYWGLLAGSAATTVAMVLGGLLPAEGDLKAGLAVGFGGATALLALVNMFGGFDGRQELNKKYTRRLDNFMWTLRSRVVSEICTAPSVESARRRIKRIHKTYKIYCGPSSQDDGTYRP